MLKSYLRLALLQIVLILLAVGVAKWGVPKAAAGGFGGYFRDFGWWLLVLPVAWCGWAVKHARRDTATLRTGSLAFVAGLGLTLALALTGSVALAFLLRA